jgi:phosphoribosylformylglycinamidine (FGAM) synthase-like enzyme
LQIGNSSPDVDPADLKSMWGVTQGLLRKRAISAGHDISDGGIAVALAEMAFAGNVGIQVRSAPGNRSLLPGIDPTLLVHSDFNKRETVWEKSYTREIICAF